MLCFHHVNLGVAPDGVTAEAEFLTAVLGYRKLETPTGSTAGVSAIKFEGDDGSQIHLTIDSDYRPSRSVHIAVELGDDLSVVHRRLEDGGYAAQVVDGIPGAQVVFCKDPAGNGWELRRATG